MEEKDTVLTIKNVSKSYMPTTRSIGDPIKALSGVSFSVSQGLYGLLGPNGAGKSTLINIIIGNLSPDDGGVFWNGKPTIKLGQQFRRILGYMPQQQTLYDGFTGARFLQYICALKEIPRKSISMEVDRVADAVNLGNQLGKKLSAYSGGMKQRILAAAALIGQPKLIILDEPTAGLDPKERVRFRNMMKQYSKQAVILLATHVVSDVEQVADSIIMLKNGKIAMMDSPQLLISDTANCSSLEEVYLTVFGKD